MLHSQFCAVQRLAICSGGVGNETAKRWKILFCNRTGATQLLTPGQLKRSRGGVEEGDASNLLHSFPPHSQLLHAESSSESLDWMVISRSLNVVCLKASSYQLLFTTWTRRIYNLIKQTVPIETITQYPLFPSINSKLYAIFIFNCIHVQLDDRLCVQWSGHLITNRLIKLTPYEPKAPKIFFTFLTPFLNADFPKGNSNQLVILPDYKPRSPSLILVTSTILEVDQFWIGVHSAQ